MTNVAPVNPGLITSPIYRVKGQRSRWDYPHERVTPEHCLILENINLTERGLADSRFGASKWNSTILANSESSVGIRQQTYSTGQYILVCTPDKVYTDDGSTRLNATGSLTLTGTVDDYVSFAFMGDKIYATNGVDVPWDKDNDYIATVGNAAHISFDASGVSLGTCQQLVEHNGVLIAIAPTEGGVKYPTRIRWSDVDSRTFIPDPTYWPDANRMEIYQGSTPIISAIDNFGSLWIFKEDGVYPGRIEYDVGFLEFRLDEKKILRGFNPVGGHQSMIARPDFIFGIAQEGAFRIDADGNFKIVTEDIQDQWESALNLARLKYAVSYVRERDHQVRVLMSGTGNTTGHNLELVYDWQTGDVWIDKLTAQVNYATRVVLSNKESAIGAGIATNNYIYKFNDPDAITDDGTAYDWEIRMAPNDLGHPGKTKHIVRFKTLYKGRDDQTTVDLTLFRNEGVLPSRSQTLTPSLGLIWDGGQIWDNGIYWETAGESVQSTAYFVNRFAETIAPRWKSSAPGAILGYQCEYTIEEG